MRSKQQLVTQLFLFGILVFCLAVACGDDGEALPRVGVGEPIMRGEHRCEPQTNRICGITLEQSNGAMTCFRGTQQCSSDGRWGACADGEVTREVDPTSDARPEWRDAFSLSAPTSCHDNPCDPGCMYFDEPGPFANGGAGGAPEVVTTTFDWDNTDNSAACAHGLCDEGAAALDRDCHPCVELVCAQQPSCCDGSAVDSWDSECVRLVYEECAGITPGALICDYAILAEVDATVVSNGTLEGHVGSGNSGITLGDSAEVNGDLRSLGPIFTGTHTDISGSVYSTYVGAGNGVTIGQDSDIAGPILVAGDGEFRGEVDLGTPLNPTEVHVGGNLFLTAGDSTIYGNVYTDGWFYSQGAAYHIEGDLHVGLETYFTTGDKTVSGNFYGGHFLDISGGSADSGIGGDAHALTSITLRNDHWINGNAYSSGTIAVCAGCTVGGSQNTPVVPLAPQAARFPVFPTLPVIDDLRRDTTAVCDQARNDGVDMIGGDVVVTPGVYGSVEPGWLDELRLVGGGQYVFQSVDLSWRDRFVFEGTGPWDIVVCDNVTDDQGDPRGGPDMRPSFAASIGGGSFELATGGVPNPQDVTIYSAETSGACIALGHIGFSGMFIAPDCDILAMSDAFGVANLWARNVWTANAVPLTSIPSEDCNEGSLVGSAACGAVPLFTEGASYSPGDSVSFDGETYQCRPGQTSHCRNDSPTGVDNNPYWPGRGGMWSDAWERTGECPSMSVPRAISADSCPVTLDLPATQPPQVACYSGLDCQINSTCTEVLTAPECQHSKCVAGAPLDDGACSSADPCVEMICDAEPSCCDSGGFWDQALCVAKVETVCDAECGTPTVGGCAHDGCAPGVALDAGCETGVATVCAAIPSCCSSAWAQACVEEYTEVVTGTVYDEGPISGASSCDYALINGNGAMNLAGAMVTGDLLNTDGAINGNGSVTGSARATLNINHTGVFGTVDGNNPSVPIAVAPWPNPPGCVGLPSGVDSWTTDQTEGQFGDVDVDADISLSPGNYYVNSFEVWGHTVTLPDAGDVNIYVCNGNVDIRNSSQIVSPAFDPFQMRVWAQSGNITLFPDTLVHGALLLGGSGGSGSASMQNNSTLFGVLHNFRGTLTTSSSASIVGPASDAERDRCLLRGTDPTETTINLCPSGSTPVGLPTTTESGTCEDNSDTFRVDVDWCPDVDLSAALACNDNVPVCNHGNVEVPAGEAEIEFYPVESYQFGQWSPDSRWSDSTCLVTEAIPAGTCVEQTCPRLGEDKIARVRLTGSASVSECSQLDNWTYAPLGQGCSHAWEPTERVVTEVYEAICPADSSASWGNLFWDAATQGDAAIAFDARTSSDGAFSGGWTSLGSAQTASSTELCDAFSSCYVDLSAALYSGGSIHQREYLELRMTLSPDGTDIATLNSWEVYYTCLIDQ